MSDLPKLTYFLADDGACGWYRLSLPMMELEKQGLARICRVAKGDDLKHVEKSLSADMFVIPRLYDGGDEGLLATMRKLGKPFVIDFDDDLFNIHPLSKHYEDFGTEEVKIRLNGEVCNLWTDGIANFNLEENRKKLEAIKRACREASMITVTTDLLAEVYREFNENVAVLPNCLRFSMWNRLPLIPHEPEIRMLWTGGSSHYADWYLLSEVMPKIMTAYPNVKLILGGAKFDGTLKNCPQDRIEYHGWTNIIAHHLQCAIFDADIALIPLEDNEFNSRKSCIKWLEMAALKIPSVCSYVSPYKEIFTEHNAIMVENNKPEGWIKGISMLIENSGMREWAGEAAYDYALEHFDIEKNAHLWMEAYDKCLAIHGH